MMRIAIDINGITKTTITIANVTKSGLSNDRLNQYSVYMNGKSIGEVDHWRDDGHIKLCEKVFRLVNKKTKKDNRK